MRSWSVALRVNVPNTCFYCLVTKSCLTLSNPVDCSPPGSSVHGISQARIPEWVAISSSRGSSNPGIESESPALQEDFITEPPGKLPPNTWDSRLKLVNTVNICPSPARLHLEEFITQIPSGRRIIFMARLFVKEKHWKCQGPLQENGKIYCIISFAESRNILLSVR